MKRIRFKISEYSQEEIQRFDEMHLVLKRYNEGLGTKEELPLPLYSADEMSCYSVYRELLIAENCRED